MYQRGLEGPAHLAAIGKAEGVQVCEERQTPQHCIISAWAALKGQLCQGSDVAEGGEAAACDLKTIVEAQMRDGRQGGEAFDCRVTEVLCACKVQSLTVAAGTHDRFGLIWNTLERPGLGYEASLPCYRYPSGPETSRTLLSALFASLPCLSLRSQESASQLKEEEFVRTRGDWDLQMLQRREGHEAAAVCDALGPLEAQVGEARKGANNCKHEVIHLHMTTHV